MEFLSQLAHPRQLPSNPFKEILGGSLNILSMTNTSIHNWHEAKLVVFAEEHFNPVVEDCQRKIVDFLAKQKGKKILVLFEGVNKPEYLSNSENVEMVSWDDPELETKGAIYDQKIRETVIHKPVKPIEEEDNEEYDWRESLAEFEKQMMGVAELVVEDKKDLKEGCQHRNEEYLIPNLEIYKNNSNYDQVVLITGREHVHDLEVLQTIKKYPSSIILDMVISPEIRENLTKSPFVEVKES